MIAVLPFTMVFTGNTPEDLTAEQIAAMELGQQRAMTHLQQAAALQLEDNTLKVINLTGHKLITGYPEGRRMWLEVEVRNELGTTLWASAWAWPAACTPRRRRPWTWGW